MTHRQRKQPPRLPCSSDRRYTSFKELGVASPQLEGFETDDIHNNGNGNGTTKEERTAPNAKYSVKAQAQAQAQGGGAGKKQETRKERGKGEEGRARSGSMRLVEWIMRTRSASSAP